MWYCSNMYMYMYFNSVYLNMEVQWIFLFLTNQVPEIFTLFALCYYGVIVFTEIPSNDENGEKLCLICTCTDDYSY